MHIEYSTALHTHTHLFTCIIASTTSYASFWRLCSKTKQIPKAPCHFLSMKLVAGIAHRMHDYRFLLPCQGWATRFPKQNERKRMQNERKWMQHKRICGNWKEMNGTWKKTNAKCKEMNTNMEGTNGKNEMNKLKGHDCQSGRKWMQKGHEWNMKGN